MANFDNIGEFNLDQVLARRLTTPGGAVAPTVAPELFSNLTLENDRPEWGYLKGEMLCSNRVTRAALAGNYTMAQFYLPSTARTIAVVKRVTNWNNVALALGRGVGISAGLGGWVAATVPSTARDFRFQPNRCSAIIETNQNVAVPSTHGRFTRMFGVGILTYDQPIIVTPGTSLIFYTDLVNEAIDVCIDWTERGAQPGELV